jgi:hypothetical protein
MEEMLTVAEPGEWPEAVAGLPVCPVRGLPMPVSSGRDRGTGAGRFGVNDPVAKLACGLCRACGVCGRALTAMIVFLAVDYGADPDRLVFSDPGMHEPCAEASMALCPFIQRERVPHRDGARTGKPGWLWVASPSYQLVPGRGAALVAFRPGPVEAVRRFRYVGGRLAEVKWRRGAS